MFDEKTTVADVVLEHSECAPVFQRHRIDFCCKGGRSVADAAKERALDLELLMDELTSAVSTRRTPRPDPRSLSTPRLIAHIVVRHHEYLRRTMPFVTALAAKVARVHGEHDVRLRELDDAVRALHDAILPHLDREELILFPALTAPWRDETLIASELEGMEREHLGVAELLERIRATSDDFSLPPWACNSYRTLFAELSALVSNVLEHVHLENHVLRPRFMPATAAATAR